MNLAGDNVEFLWGGIWATSAVFGFALRDHSGGAGEP